MRVWQVAVVLNLTFAVGLGLGYAGWGRRADALDREFEAARAQVERLERERQACAAGGRAGEQQWDGRGVVRAIYPHLVVVTHEEIRGLLQDRHYPEAQTLANKLAGEAGVPDEIASEARDLSAQADQEMKYCAPDYCDPSPQLGDSVRVGDPVRFSLRGTLIDDAALVTIERW